MASTVEEEEEESFSVNVRRMEKGSHEFVVEGYSSLCSSSSSSSKGIDGVNKSVDSQEFSVGGHRWAICFYPDGLDEACHSAGYASVFLALRSDCGDQPVRCLVEFQILDRSGKGNHFYPCPSCFLDGGGPAPKLPGGRFPCFKMRGNKWGFPRAFKREILDCSSSDYVKDDCFTIRCTVGVLSSNIRSCLPCFVAKRDVVGIRKDFLRLLETKQGADVRFRVAGGETFEAHKSILAARSPVFLSLLRNHQEEEVVVPNVEPRIFQALLRFIYSGSFQEDDKSSGASVDAIFFWGNMLAAADQFELKRLRKVCEAKILARLSVESVAYLLHVAELHRAAELKSICLNFVADNRSAVLESEGFEYLKEACPALFLDLAGFNENKERKEDDVGSNFVAVVKESLIAVFRRWDAVDMWQKIKEF